MSFGINVLGPSVSVEIDRFFTTPPDVANTMDVRVDNQVECVETPAADCFNIFLQSVFDAIQGNNYQNFIETLLVDADALHRLREAAQEG